MIFRLIFYFFIIKKLFCAFLAIIKIILVSKNRLIDLLFRRFCY